MSGEEIHFYAASGEYGCFSNFSPHRVSVGGVEWKTAEHYFQAQKFAGTDAERAIRAAPTPARAKELGNSRSLPLRKDWEKVKEGVMEIALRAKFEQNPDARKALVGTGDRRLVERTRQVGWGRSLPPQSRGRRRASGSGWPLEDKKSLMENSSFWVRSGAAAQNRGWRARASRPKRSTLSCPKSAEKRGKCRPRWSRPAPAP
jgi:ribA/ribD-fused uncharacterized protein